MRSSSIRAPVATGAPPGWGSSTMRSLEEGSSGRTAGGSLMNRGPARGHRIEGDFRLERRGFAIRLERDDLGFKQDGFAQRDDWYGSRRYPAERDKQCERLASLQFTIRILLMEFKACPSRYRTGGRGSG